MLWDYKTKNKKLKDLVKMNNNINKKRNNK